MKPKKTKIVRPRVQWKIKPVTQVKQSAKAYDRAKTRPKNSKTECDE